MSIRNELMHLIDTEYKIDDIISKLPTNELKEELTEALLELIKAEIGMQDIRFEDEPRNYKNIEFTEKGIYGE